METPTDLGLSHQVEEDLIKACAVTIATEARRATIRSLLGNCRDWAYVIEACRAHGVSALICFNLEANAPDLVPPEIRGVLVARFKANACRNLFLTQELLALVGEFRKNGMDLIPFKGPLLAVTVYGNVALREFLDLDILVPQKNLRRARELLISLGYQTPAGQLTESYFKSQLGCEYIRADGRVALELHWSFLQKWLGFHLDPAAIWAAPQQIKVGPVPVLVLPPDVTLLYLCAHGTKHSWSRLSWVVDVAELLRTHTELKWDALLTLAETSGCRRTLFIGLHLAKTLLGASVPEPVWAQVTRDRVAVALAQKLGEKMFAPQNDACRDRFGWARDWFHIRTKERWREKVGYLCQVVHLALQPSDKDRHWVRLPRWLDWLYVFLRPIRVTWQKLPAAPRGDEGYRGIK